MISRHFKSYKRRSFIKWGEEMLDICRKDAKTQIRNFLLENQIKKVPKVRFADGREHVILPHVWNLRVTSKLRVYVCQIPLILAWALTTHKGMTLDFLCIDFADTWKNAAGLVYVAMSRAKNEEGMEICGFRKDMVCANKRVEKFYEGLVGDA
ncbi:ATP-dependent DNA helicase PIF1 [Neolecta irregularis DAH-3]|uniref:ATP-dependent DNA helicase PIF1 n=1 Tax=Neolecta irregularis (strain DAH-3) TaxID=1198029 RepID=A0A1U7LT95_NEOID|nr:ATP-dependent DNA helicase PIF1 [Neolecta irregularis DAH-3]|eukprot:OLL25895.1 ATP-dependent DNA helicase PIF1 [Neolecta irregularis DAH-3]